MSDETIKININGIMTKVKNAEVISYDRLCELAVQPAKYRPKITCSLGPHRMLAIHPGDDAPLHENAVYNVWITGDVGDH